MKILAQNDDAGGFVERVESIANSLLEQHKPQTALLLKIDNWFGFKWHGFSGKALGALGVWNNPFYHPSNEARVPPFVPGRVVLQRRFAAPDYHEIDRGEPIHKEISSSECLQRRLSEVAPNAALIWYSGNSRAAGRGALMAYLPIGDSYWPWYSSWQSGDPWSVTQTKAIKREELQRLLNHPKSYLGKE